MIIYKYYGWAPNNINKIHYEDKFKTIAGLKAYFLRNPGAGALVGYGKRKPHESWAFSATLIIQWTDEKMIVRKREFEDVFRFADFLNDHPEIAKAVEYVRRR